MMKKIVLYGIFLWSNVCVVYSQVKDIGYKIDCFEYYYPTIIFEELLKTIDTNKRNRLINNENIEFSVTMTLNANTGYPKEIIINDASHFLSCFEKEMFKNRLLKIQFELCHNDYLRKNKSSKEIYPYFKFKTSSFQRWWFLRGSL
jgi:hypothetical protein